MTTLARGWPAIGLAAGLAVGIATSYLQGVLPGSWNTLANSGAVWTVVAFGVAATVVSTPSWTVAAGLTTLLGEVLGYYAVASPIRGIATSTTERTLWIAAAIVVGVPVGWAAWLVRRGPSEVRPAAALALCGVVVGEGVHGLLRISRTSAAAWTEVVLGAAVAALVVVRARVPPWSRLGAIGVGVLVTLVVAAVYGETVLR